MPRGEQLCKILSSSVAEPSTERENKIQENSSTSATAKSRVYMQRVIVVVISPIEIFKLGDKAVEMCSSHASSGQSPISAIVDCLWGPSRKHGGLFVLNLSPLSKSLQQIKLDFYEVRL